MGLATRTVRIAVLIVNRNSGRLLDTCLERLSRQTRPADRTIVVDNASDDGSAADLEARFPGIELIRLDGNAGFARANNVAAERAADCDWLALLNPDAFAEPEWLAALARAAATHTGCASFASQMRMATDPSRLDGAGDAYHVSGLPWRRAHGLSIAALDPTQSEVFSACAAAALYRRDAFCGVDGFDNAYFCYSEDVDLGFRLRLQGFRCLYVPDAVVHHVGSAVSGKMSGFSLYYGHRNLVWTYVKDMPTALFWLYLPQHFLLNVVSLCWFSLRGQTRVIFRAKRDALRGLPAIWRARAAVRASRRISLSELRRMMVRGFAAPYRARLERHVTLSTDSHTAE